MKTIIYRKSDLQCVSTVINNITVDEMIKLNVITNFGGVVSDYDSIETDKENFHLENINGVVTVVENHIVPYIDEIKDNTIKIKKTISTTQPQDITVTDKTTYWNIIVTRNIISQVVDNITYYTYEYIETTLPKGTDTADQVKAVLAAKKDALFSDAEYPAFNTYDANTSSTDLLKLVFSLIDTNKSLTARVTALEAK